MGGHEKTKYRADQNVTPPNTLIKPITYVTVFADFHLRTCHR
jgi:hypothetical protein